MEVKLKRFFDTTFFLIMLSLLLYFYISLAVSRNFFLIKWSAVDVSEVLQSTFSFDTIVFHLHESFQFQGPIYGGIAGMLFVSIRKHLWPFQAPRTRTYRGLVLHDILLNSLHVALACYAAFLLIFFLHIAFATPADVERGLRIARAPDILPPRSTNGASLFLDLFGVDFYFDHRKLYYFMVYSVQYGYAPFLFSIMGSTLGLVFEKRYQVLLVTVLTYYALTLFFNRLGGMNIMPSWLHTLLQYLEPARLCIPNSLRNIATIPFFILQLIPTLLPSGLIIRNQIRHAKVRV